MDIQFLKLQSCGNDYILVDSFKSGLPDPEHYGDLAAQMSSRRHGVGGEGLLLLEAGERESHRVRFFLPDHREVEPELGVLRCASRYAFDAGLVADECFRLETNERQREVEVLDSRNVQILGDPPRYWDRKRELKERVHETYSASLQIGDREERYVPVFLQIPHAVFFDTEYASPLGAGAGWQQVQEAIGQDIICTVARVISRETLSARTWQSAVARNQVNESGGCAAMVASVLSGLTDRNVLVHLEGGDLFVQWLSEDNNLVVTGAVDYLFTGNFYFEERDEGSEPALDWSDRS